MKYTQNIPWYKNIYLKKNLKNKESTHYVFYFPEESLAEHEIDKIIELKEEHYSKIIKWLRLKTDRKINYYLYSNIKEKEALKEFHVL